VAARIVVVLAAANENKAQNASGRETRNNVVCVGAARNVARERRHAYRLRLSVAYRLSFRLRPQPPPFYDTRRATATFIAVILLLATIPKSL
jgi:hypothetical protein